MPRPTIRRATVAQYRGTLVDGRFEGEGEFVDSAGFSYSGAWRDGLMEGEGRLMLANGDEYVGVFRGGLRDGDGIFTTASGFVYRAGFTAGVPNAASRFSRRRRTGLRIGIVAERRPHNYEIGLDPMSYTIALGWRGPQHPARRPAAARRVARQCADQSDRR